MADDLRDQMIEALEEYCNRPDAVEYYEEGHVAAHVDALMPVVKAHTPYFPPQDVLIAQLRAELADTSEAVNDSRCPGEIDQCNIYRILHFSSPQTVEALRTRLSELQGERDVLQGQFDWLSTAYGRRCNDLGECRVALNDALAKLAKVEHIIDRHVDYDLVPALLLVIGEAP